MSTGRWPALIAVVLLGVSLGACVSGPKNNRRPAIISLTATPDSIGPYDSTTVVCRAQDPDGDVLVYDWITDARLTMQGTRPNEYWLYNTYSNSHVFYPGPTSLGPVDTAWVQCFARDRRGMSDNRTIHFLVHR